jgi:hypothetical protein
MLPILCILCLAPGVLAQDVEVEVTSEKPVDEAAKRAPPQLITLARGTLKLSVPGEWKLKPTRSRIIEKEFEIPAAKGDKNAARLTMTSAQGSIQANVDRWIGQFSQPDGKKTSERTKIIDKKVNGQDVKIVTITGDFQESIGPPRFGKSVTRPNYRMLAAIVQTKQQGQYFFKAYGPDQTMSLVEDRFLKMIDSIGAP